MVRIALNDLPPLDPLQLTDDLHFVITEPDKSGSDALVPKTQLAALIERALNLEGAGAALADLASKVATLKSSNGVEAISYRPVGQDAVVRALDQKLQDLPITPRDFGAVGDGIADDTQAFIRARTASHETGRAIHVPAGRYRLTRALTAKQDLVMYGDGDSTVLDFTGGYTGGNYALVAEGTLTKIANLSASPQQGQTTISLTSVTDLQVGDKLILWNPAESSFSEHRTYYRDGEWCEIESIEGNVLTLCSPLYSSYVASQMEVYLVRGPRMEVRSLKIQGLASAGLLRADLCLSPYVERVSITNTGNTGISFARCWSPTVVEPQIDNHGSTQDDYGIIFGNTQHGRVYGGSVFSRRHAIATGGGPDTATVPCRDIVVDGTLLRNKAPSIWAADFHGNTTNSKYINCTILGGFALQGENNAIVNCEVHAMSNGVIGAFAEVVGGNLEVLGCRLISNTNPQGAMRGLLDVGGNSTTAFNSLTVKDTCFRIKDCSITARGMNNTTSFFKFMNRGSMKKANFELDGLNFNVDALNCALYTGLVSGNVECDFVVIDRIYGLPVGVPLHNTPSGTYSQVPRRLQVDMASAAGSAAVGYQQNATASILRKIGEKFTELPLTPLDFGAVGNGVADDAAALERAMIASSATGRPLDFLNLTYRTSRSMTVSGIRAVNWISNGATIVLDPTVEHQAYVLRVTVNVGVQHNILGQGLTFDCSEKANIGLYVEQTTNDRTASFRGDNLKAMRARRSTAFIGCDGIYVRGGFRIVELRSPEVRDIALPAGTGTVGSQGATGITVARGSVGYPEFVDIQDPIVEKIWSLDPAYSMDMDGIRIFGPPDTAGRAYSSCRIVRPRMRDCWGRFVKIQMSAGKVESGFFIHSQQPTDGIVNPSVDFQNGPGEVIDCNWIIDGVNLLSSLVSQQSPINGGWKAGTLSGGGASIINGGSLLHVISNYPRQATYGLVRAKDFTTTGPISMFARILTPDINTVFVVENVQCDELLDAFVNVIASGGAAPRQATIRASYCINRGAAVPLVRSGIAGVAANSTLDETGCVGFGPAASRFAAVDTTKSGLAKFVKSFARDTGVSGTMDLQAKSLAANETWELAPHGYTQGTHLALISLNHSAQTFALVSLSNSEGAILAVAGTEAAAGGLTEPTTGTLRVWKGANGMCIKNAATSGRVATVQLIG